MAAVFGPERKPLGHPATTRLINQLWPDPPMDLVHRESHPCGKCGYPAAYFDRSLASGAVAFICYACDPKGHLTLASQPVGALVDGRER